MIDSQSVDDTEAIALQYGARVVQFHYRGGWPKKRQWAMETLPFAFDWLLLLDADEVLTPELKTEMRQAIQNPQRERLFHFIAHVVSRSGIAPRRRQFLEAIAVSTR